MKIIHNVKYTTDDVHMLLAQIRTKEKHKYYQAKNHCFPYMLGCKGSWLCAYFWYRRKKQGRLHFRKMCRK